MKVTVEEDEWWPVYSLEKPRRGLSDIEVIHDIPKELYDRYIRVMEAFGEMQSIIQNLEKEKK